MPTQIVDVDLRTETGAIAQRTYSDLVVVGRHPDVADPDYNEPKVYDSSSLVSSDFGTGSDVYAASQQIEQRGARQWWVVMVDTQTQSETFGNTEATSEFTLENTPLVGGTDNIDIEVDGTEATVVESVESPPSAPSSGEVALNFESGEGTSGDETDGTESGIIVDYETLNWQDAVDEMVPQNFDLAILADTRADRSYIGELDLLLDYAESEDVSVVTAYDNGNNYDDDETAMEAAHEIGGYHPSGYMLPIAHKSDDDVAAGVAGRLATKQPWFNPFMDGGADYSFSTEEYRRSLIGGPEQPGTFEGGDSEGSGPVNVLHTEMGVQILSNSLSTAGEASNYQYFDVSRTESFIETEAINALRSLRLRSESIPFAPIGRTMIENALRKTLNQYVSSTGRALSQEEITQLQRQAEAAASGEEGEETQQVIPETRSTNSEAQVPMSELNIHVPRYDDLSQQSRANRVWEGIEITAQLAGDAHTFSVGLAVRV